MDRQTNDEQPSAPADNESAKRVLPSEDSVVSTAGLATNSIFFRFLFVKTH